MKGFPENPVEIPWKLQVKRSYYFFLLFFVMMEIDSLVQQ